MASSRCASFVAPMMGAEDFAYYLQRIPGTFWWIGAGTEEQGCVAGIHEVLRRQGLLQGIWCLDPKETLSPGQDQEIDRVWHAYPHLRDDAFVQQNLDRWLRT